MNATAATLALTLGLVFASTACTRGECTDPNTPGCLVASDKQRIVSPDVPPADLRALVTGNTDFAMDLHQHLRAQKGNLFYSPFSISEALTMASAGARGDTLAGMTAALHLDLPTGRLHLAFDALDLAITSRGKDAKGVNGHPFEINLANALWGQIGYSFEAPFLDTLAQDYGAGMHVVDFEKDSGGAIDLINGWVSDKTEGKIPELVDGGSVDSDTRLVLTNAIYFNAAWANQFEPGSTHDGSFTTAGGSKVQVPLMHMSSELRYAKGSGWAAVEMPYDGGQVSMVAVLPDAGTFDSFESSLTGDSLGAILGGLEDGYEVDLTFPKLKLDASFDLGDRLSKMGMAKAFTPDADFTGIHAKGGIYIGSVVHKAFASVDENGTEAAAATAVSLETGAGPAGGTAVAIRFDHPFLFVIRDNETGAVLFVGRVADPS